jgi:hypothetical protein
MGGLNANFSCPGDAGVGFDFEYAIRLWREGHSVGLADLEFTHRGGGGGGSQTTTRGGESSAAAVGLCRLNQVDP